MDDDGLDPDGAGARAAGRPGELPLHDPDVPEPERADAAARASAARRRAGARARVARARGRSLRARPLRGRRRRRACTSWTTRAPSRTPRRSRRPSRPASASAGSSLPADLAAAVEERAVSTYISPPFLIQATVHELIARGAFEHNLERIRGLLKARRDAMLAALERELDGRATWSRPEGGYFVWADLPADASELLERATEAGRHVRPRRRLLPTRRRRRPLGPPRVQLRVAVCDRRGRVDARLAPVGESDPGGRRAAGRAARAARRRSARREARAGSPR